MIRSGVERSVGRLGVRQGKPKAGHDVGLSSCSRSWILFARWCVQTDERRPIVQLEDLRSN